MNITMKTTNDFSALSAKGLGGAMRRAAMTLLLAMMALTTAWAQNVAPKTIPLTLKAIDDGTITVYNPQEDMQYYKTGGTKTAMSATTEIPVTAGQTVQFYGNGTSIKSYYGTNIDCSEDCYIYGNIMSLVDETGFANNTTLTEDDTFSMLFVDNAHLKNDPDHQLLLPATKLAKYCYSSMFYGCTGLTKAPDLPATKLAEYCYHSMFFGCTGLTKAPELPATTLAGYCYENMFTYCTGLTEAPVLPATTLAAGCYQYMFQGCSNLNTVKCPATDISARDCTLDWLDGVAAKGTFVKEESMKGWTTGVSGIPDGWTVVGWMKLHPLTLEAIDNGTITVTEPQSGMQYSIDGGAKMTLTTENNQIQVSAGQKVQFYGDGTNISSYNITRIGCSADCYIYGNIMSLVDETGFATATTLTEGETFISLFNGNSNLKNHPDHQLLLPATTLAEGCYKSMFNGCTGLTVAPELPATTLAEFCYAGMFEYCNGLTAAPELPATELAEFCYTSMFKGCTGLTAAPELPATTLTALCYDNMFFGCRGLTTAPDLPATTLAEGCYQSMFNNCTNLSYVRCMATDISAYVCTRDWLDGVASQGTFVKAEGMEDWDLGASGIPEDWTVVGGMKGYPLTLEAKVDGTITVDSPQEGMQYSINGGKKRPVTTAPISISAGQKVQFYGNGTSIAKYSGTHIDCSADCYIYGNIMSLVDEMRFPTATTLPENNTFMGLFSGNIYLKNHPTHQLVLPATTLARKCYENMFWGCTGLTEAPDLPATKLSDCCYASMFQGCTGLTVAPELPATTLAMGCYQNMFSYCTGLTEAPVLPATTLAGNCYQGMFQDCSNLNYVKCPATDISASNCTSDWLDGVAAHGTFVKAESMESWTTGVSGIPDGWTLAEGIQLQPLTLEAIAGGTITVVKPQEGMQYSINGGAKTEMTTDNTQIQVTAGQKVQFYGKRKNITSYSGTRFQCSANCYIYGNIMSLVDEMSYEFNTTLTADNTFEGLFSANIYLKNHSTNKLLLPATTLTKNCYSSMFNGCTGLTAAPDLLAPTLAKNCYKEMFKYCSNLNFVKCMATDISADGCTTSWLAGVASEGIFLKAVKTEWSTGASGIPNGWTPKPYTQAPALTLEAIADGTIKVQSPRSDMKYSIDGGTKTTMTATTEIPVTAGQKVQLYGNGTSITSYNTRIQCSADCYIYGNIMSLVDENEFEYNITLPANNTFNALFYNNSHLKNHPDNPLVLPAITLKQNCYYNMFYGCSGLTIAPELPATTLTSSCYYNMFYGCKGLTEAPELPATTLATSCYSAMFNGCTSLTEAPKLSATELAASCYSQMFLGCSSLTEAPDLPATTLATSCYSSMFNSCTSLTTAPDLLATTLTENCYANMFYGCRNLNYVKCLATDISAEGCTTDWLKSVAAQGTFVKAKNTSWSRGTSGIPEGWTVVGPDGITLYDTGDNRATLEAKDGQTLDYVMLDGRMLYKDGYWNTLCLPFDVEDGDDTDGVTFSGTPLEGATVMELDVDGYYDNTGAATVPAGSTEGLHKTGLDGSTLYLYFQNVNKIEAGVPYIIRWGTPKTPAGGTISAPVFQDVKVSNATDNVTFTGGSFKGTYESTTFTDENQSILFLGEGNTLYYPEAGATIGAQRAYFQLTDGQSARQFVLRFREEDTQGIKEMEDGRLKIENEAGAWFTLDGRKIVNSKSSNRKLNRGVYINNGKKFVK